MNFMTTKIFMIQTFLTIERDKEADTMLCFQWESTVETQGTKGVSSLFLLRDKNIYLLD